MSSDDRHRGLAFDLDTFARRFASRREVLKLLGAAGLYPVVGCGGGAAGGAGADSGGSGPGDGDDDACSAIPPETAGPFPGDGSNGANALALSGIVRSDIRNSIAGATGTAQGLTLAIALTLVDSGSGCAPLPGRAVYVWHCDRIGDYSMYTGRAVDQNYLRGVQETDASGMVTFTTVFPGCYPGRWPHVHFEIYSSLNAATSGEKPIRTSQLAFPEAACAEAYAAAGYEQSAANLSRTSLSSDNIFSDGAKAQIASTAGDTAAGYVASLTVGVAAMSLARGFTSHV